MSTVLGFGLVAVPVSIGVGILKYRLYDIDGMISRTLAYAIVIGLLVGVYAGLVFLATHVMSPTTPVAVWLEAGCGRAVQPAAQTGPAGSAPPVQPDPV